MPLAAVLILTVCINRQDLPSTAVNEEYKAGYARHRTDLAQVGGIIEFGGRNWLALDVQGNYALIITENTCIIGEGRYNLFRGAITWAGSSIRQYLNEIFLKSFSLQDRARIRETYVINNDNPWFGSNGGDNTRDRIFLLSIEEAVRYFGDSGQLQNRPPGIRWISDEYDSARIARNDAGTAIWWWLRSPGRYQHLAAGIDPGGVISLYGTGVSNTSGGVRPALWLNLVSPWDRENFTYIKEPLRLEYDTPHGSLAVQHLMFMNDNLYSRKPFSYREKEAAVWLVQELLSMGHPWENIYVQEFPLIGDFRWWNLNNLPRWRSEFELRRTTQLSQNVILTIPGQSERKIIVGAHYDSWPAPGAADNASGTALLLESAQRMLKMNNYYTIVYVFFGAHEAGGFIASNLFVQNLTEEQSSNIVFMINADALFDGPYIFYGAAYNDNSQPGANALTQRIDAIADKLDLGLIRNPRVAFLNSDNQAFLYRGHTVVHLTGLFRVELPGYTGIFSMDGAQFTRGVSHTQNDCFHIIEARWPGKIQTNMRAFSIFLEELLMMSGTNCRQ